MYLKHFFLHTQPKMNVLAMGSFFLGLALLCIIWRILSTSHKRNKTLPPPEPSGAWPLIGHMRILNSQIPIFRALGDLADKQGPVFSIRLGMRRTLVISSWESVKECLKTNDRNFLNRPSFAASKYMGYDDAFFGFHPYGEYWLEMRKIVTQELLSNHRLQLFIDVRVSEIETCIKELYTTCSNGSVLVDMSQRFSYVVASVMLRLIAGKRYCGGIGKESEAFGRAIKEFFYLSGVLVMSDLIPFTGWMDFQGHLKSMKRVAKELDHVVSGWLEEHLQRREAVNVRKEEKDFMDVMLESLAVGDDPIFGYKRETIVKATALNLIIAGVDTTSVALTWRLSLLLNHTEVLKEVQKEIDIHVGTTRWVEESDIKNLVYFQAIVKETLRLYPPGPSLLPRRRLCPGISSGLQMLHLTLSRVLQGFNFSTAMNVQVDMSEGLGLTLAKATPLGVVLAPRLEHKMFLTSHGSIDVRGQQFEYVPFGSGRRLCPGISSGLQMVYLTLSRLLQGFSFSTAMNAQVDMSIFLGLALLCIIWRILSTSHKRNKTLPPPEPSGAWPSIGHMRILNSQIPIFRALGDLADKHGPVFSIRLGLRRTLVISSRESVKECLKTNDRKFLNRPSSAASKYMGYDDAFFGFHPYGEYWLEMRKIVTQELLSNRRLQMLMNVRVSEIDTCIKELYTTCSNGSVLVDMSQWFSHVVASVMFRLLAGKRYCGGIAKESEAFVRAIKEFFYLSGVLVMSDLIPFTGWMDLQGHLKSMKRVAKELDHVVSGWLEEHLQRREAVNVRERRKDFMDVMLESLAVVDDPIFGYKRRTIVKATALRFLTSHGSIDVRGQQFEYVPFGSGRRLCPGISSSLQMLHLTLSRLLQGFSFSTAMNAQVDMSEGLGLTLPKATPLEVVLAPRLDHKINGKYFSRASSSMHHMENTVNQSQKKQNLTTTEPLVHGL
uniref:Cytochrome P450 n=1 Tax=Salix viminalis TaxID=40686 RepID=A0A6N2K142_SALVM